MAVVWMSIRFIKKNLWKFTIDDVYKQFAASGPNNMFFKKLVGQKHNKGFKQNIPVYFVKLPSMIIHLIKGGFSFKKWAMLSLNI